MDVQGGTARTALTGSLTLVRAPLLPYLAVATLECRTSTMVKGRDRWICTATSQGASAYCPRGSLAVEMVVYLL